MTSSPPQRPAPRPTPETKEFWDGTAAGELRLQRCRPCDAFYFPPRPFCPHCLGDDVAWERTAGRGRLYSYVINHRPPPPFGTEPYAIAIVELDEGPRMMSNIVSVPNTPDDLILDMAVEVTFEQRGDVAVPLFVPAVGEAGAGA